MKSKRMTVAATGLSAAITLTLMLALTVVGTPAALAQTYKVIYTFTGGGDGGAPYAGVAMDNAGNLYGTAQYGGTTGNGTVYQLSHTDSGWVFDPLYSFTGGSDGANPIARVIFGPDGALYGTTSAGGVSGAGTVFKLRPAASACKTALCYWAETVLYQFGGPPDGAYPGGGDLLFDQAGNIYDTTFYGGIANDGVVYELMPSGSSWAESVLYSFGGGSDGTYPYNGVIPDNAGNLYGTTAWGGGSNKCRFGGCGTVFQFTPSGSGWTKNVIYSFQGGNDGSNPFGGVILDQSGNLYGGTENGGTGGTVFELSPNSDGSWTYILLYSLPGYGYADSGPYGKLAMDAAGNLYGTTYGGGKFIVGNVFKLTKTGGGWKYTSLYDFKCGSDGGVPIGGVTLDPKGNLYGTASICAATGCGQGCGVVWEIKP